MADQHDNDPLLGAMFHGYRVEQQLAQGGMGTVYICRHAELPHLRKVLKVLATTLEESDSTAASAIVRQNAERNEAFLRDRFEREAVAVSKLHHRYIVPIDSIGVVAGRRCILMPYLEGRPLAKLIDDRGGPLTPEEALHIAAQIARALDHAHQRGIVHRDIKPENVFVTPTEDDPLSIKVIDFGIAKQWVGQPSTEWRSPLGTLPYMAPEQFEHASSATAATDVYSLGVMLYVMMTGRHPWPPADDETPFVTYRRRLEEAPAPAPEFPSGWEEVILSALSPEPRKRPQSMRGLVYPLALLLPGGLPILGAVARRWTETAAHDETLRGTAATSGAWRAANSGAWPATSSGAWPATSSGAWPATSAGAWPATSSGAWSAPSSGIESAPGPVAWPNTWPSGAWPNTWPSGSWPSARPSLAEPAHTPERPRLGPATWKLGLLGVAIAVLVGGVVFATAALARSRWQDAPAATTIQYQARGSR